MHVKRAINKVDEGSNVLNRISGRPMIEMRVLASRFCNPEEAQELDAFLIQEFMHAKDMVDPEFDYEDAFIPGNPSVKNLITARFRLVVEYIRGFTVGSCRNYFHHAQGSPL